MYIDTRDRRAALCGVSKQSPRRLVFYLNKEKVVDWIAQRRRNVNMPNTEEPKRVYLSGPAPRG